MTGKIRIAYICTFSNKDVRSRLNFHVGWATRIMWKLLRNHVPESPDDVGVWNTNAIHEFEHVDDVELHVITPCPYLSSKLQEFVLNGIHYHFFRDETSLFFVSIYFKIVRPQKYSYRSNRKIVRKLIERIQPDLVHMVGAENPTYTTSLFDIPKSIPTILQLQTLINDPEFLSHYPIDKRSYAHRSSVEMRAIMRTDYLGVRAKKYLKILKEDIMPNGEILNIGLALTEKIKIEPVKKQYDFVYFANDLSKAGDLALEAFGIAHTHNPHITLNIVGGCGEVFKQQLNNIVERYNIADVVSFEGKLETHDNVLNQISKSRFALLPLRIDLTSGTIREAIARGLPVITTDTGSMGTQQLNIDSQCVLLSPKDDAQSLADNMLRILNDPELANTLVKNATQRQEKKYSNKRIVKEYVEAYRYCIQSKNS